jgi:hypothetical protein
MSGQDSATCPREAVRQVSIGPPTNVQHLISATVSDVPEEEEMAVLSATWSPSSGLALAVLSQTIHGKKASLNGIDLMTGLLELGESRSDEEEGGVVVQQPARAKSFPLSPPPSASRLGPPRTVAADDAFSVDLADTPPRRATSDAKRSPARRMGESETKRDAIPPPLSRVVAFSASSSSSLEELSSMDRSSRSRRDSLERRRRPPPPHGSTPRSRKNSEGDEKDEGEAGAETENSLFERGNEGTL